MQRVIVALFVAFCVFLSAGCGDASLQQVSAQPAVEKAARDYSKQWFGDAHPTITHVATVQLAYGARSEVIELAGHMTYHPICMGPTLGGSGCQTEHLRHLLAAFDLADPKYPLGWESTSPAQLARIARARQARPELAIFPTFPNDGIEGVRCSIPRGTGGAVNGICLTQDEQGSIYRRPEDPPLTHPRQVEFIELWPLGPIHDRHEAVWIVTFNRRGDIASIRVTGHPPQLQK